MIYVTKYKKNIVQRPKRMFSIKPTNLNDDKHASHCHLFQHYKRYSKPNDEYLLINCIFLSFLWYIPQLQGIRYRKEHMSFNNIEAKITVAKLFELAYSKNKGMTARIVAKKGSAKLTIDQNGKAVLSNSAGMVVFSGGPVLKKIGAKVKRVNIMFSNEDGMNIGYNATFDLEVGKVIVSGKFDLEELILSCSGLLCKAARAMKGRNLAYEKELKDIMVTK